MHPPKLKTSTIIHIFKSFNSFILLNLPWISNMLFSVISFPDVNNTACVHLSGYWQFHLFYSLFCSLRLMASTHHMTRLNTASVHHADLLDIRIHSVSLNVTSGIKHKIRVFSVLSEKLMWIWLARPSAFWSILEHLNISQRSKMSQMKQSNHIPIAWGAVSVLDWWWGYLSCTGSYECRLILNKYGLKLCSCFNLSLCGKASYSSFMLCFFHI